jgi:hypothetical protein
VGRVSVVGSSYSSPRSESLPDRNSTYTFSPYTGLIYLHTINSIHPAPHEAVYDAMRTSLGRVFGLGGAGVAERIGMKGGQDGRA